MSDKLQFVVNLVSIQVAIAHDIDKLKVSLIKFRERHYEEGVQALSLVVVFRQSRRDEISIETYSNQDFPSPFMGGRVAMSLLKELWVQTSFPILQIFRPYGTSRNT